MKKQLILGIIIGIVLSAAGAGAFVLLSSNEDDTAQEMPHVSHNEEQMSSHDEDSSSLLFTNIYRGVGDRNKFEESPDMALARLVNSAEELDQWWLKLFEGSALAPPRPLVDFSNQSVLITMLDLKNEGDFLLTVQDIELNEKTLRITGQEKGPGQGCPTSKEPSRPLHIVRIAKTTADEISITTETASAAPCQILLNP